MNDLSEVTLRTGGWHGDNPLNLRFPPQWEITTFWPHTPPPLTEAQIADALNRTVGQPPVRDLCRGKKHPLLIVDDLVRPTPAACVMPVLLRHFHDAGIPAANVTVLVGTGTHPGPTRDGVIQKIGAQAASACRVVVHDHKDQATHIGRTSFGTPVLVNKELTASDFLVGIGGVYPNYSAGFGGGSKLALGVLGKRSIVHLHYKHRAPGWGTSGIGTGFRKDLDEIARLMGLSTVVTIHVDANRKPVRVVCGDYRIHYSESVSISREYYAAPPPGDADVVIANAYPTDATLQFARMKGMTPLQHAAPAASRILLASCCEGVGTHGLFPALNPLPKYRHYLRRLSTMTFGQIVTAVARQVDRQLHSSQLQSTSRPMQNPIWLYQIHPDSKDLPQFPGFRNSRSWEQILESICQEQKGRTHLRVVIYPCAAMQFLDSAARSNNESEALAGACAKEQSHV
ncbi:MAG: lactate racemase domain-containing protein [Terriglobales bacterium]